jgi:hypothetical protein
MFYAVGDFLASLLIGIVAGLAAWSLVSPGWNMWAAMVAMMPLGMIVGLVLYLPIARFLGAQEAMIPAMYTGMWAGMVVGMMAAMMHLPLRHAIEMGAACGIAEIIFIWLANTILRGVTRDGKAS